MSQLELYFLKRHTCAYGCVCDAIIFCGLRKRLRGRNFREVASALAAQLRIVNRAATSEYNAAANLRFQMQTAEMKI